MASKIGEAESRPVNPFTGEPYESVAEFVSAVHRWRSGAEVKIDPKLVAKKAESRLAAASPAAAKARETPQEKFEANLKRWKSGDITGIDPKFLTPLGPDFIALAASAPKSPSADEEEKEKPYVIKFTLDQMNIGVSPAGAHARMSEHDMAEQRHNYEMAYEALARRREEQARLKEEARLAENGKGESKQVPVSVSVVPKNRRKREARKAANPVN